MADYTELKAAIRAAIYDNTDQSITGSSLQSILIEMVDELGQSYVLPEGGIPASDLAQAVRDALAEALSAYQLPQGGIPEADLATAVRNALTAALSAYQKPQNGIPETDLAQAVRNALAAALSAYQKPQGGIPASDIADGVIPSDVLKYTPQSLTEAQKAQARLNIDAPSTDDLETVLAMDFVNVATLPAASASTMGKIYLVGPDTNNNYDRYYTEESNGVYSWVSLGSTQIDLTEYATKSELDQLGQEVAHPIMAELYGGILVAPEYVDTYINNGSNWAINSNYAFYILSVIPGETLRMKANASYATYYQGLSSFSGVTIGELAPVADPFDYVSANNEGDIVIPSGTNYLLIYSKYGGNTIVPMSIKRGDIEIFNAAGIVNKLLLKADKPSSSGGKLARVLSGGDYEDSQVSESDCVSALEIVNGHSAASVNLLPSLSIDSGKYYSSTSSTPTGSGSANKYSTGDVDISSYQQVKIVAPSYSAAGNDSRACLITDASKNILSAQTWGGQTTTTNKEISFDISSIPGAKYLLVSYSSNNCSQGITVTGISPSVPSIDSRVTALENGETPISSASRYIHISFDDIDAPFAWLAANYSTASSIFDEAFFALLRTLHRQYGAVFTLNCFLGGLTSLATAGNKFASEFVQNSDWLKIAFHAYSSGVAYDSGTTHTYRDAGTDYAAFITAIIAITGSVRNIHQVTRLGYYEGSETEVLKLKNQLMGVYGLLCSDQSSRNSYYLGTEISKLVYAQQHWYDAKNGVYFISTNTARLDSDSDVTEETAATFVAEKVNTNNSFIEVFMHQTTVFSSTANDTLYESRGNLILAALCELCKTSGYFFDYTQRHLMNW